MHIQFSCEAEFYPPVSWHRRPAASTLTTTARGATLAALLLLTATLLPEKLLVLVPNATALRIAISILCTHAANATTA